jgi:calcium-dependent protein kinase
MGCSSNKVKTIEPTNQKVNTEAGSTTATTQKPQEPHKPIGNDYKLKLSKATLVKFNPGKILNTYKVNEIIGQGSYGTVYRCKHLLTGDLRAIKKINKSTLRKVEVIEEDDMPSELKVHCLIDHPHIIKTYEYFKDDRNYYLVTEFITGGSLINKLKELKYFDEYTVALIMEQLLSCIYYLHSNNIVHRDLKPDNILLDIRNINEVSIKLIDFGLATTFEERQKINLLCGTAYYIAPEVIQESYDNQCDLWSAGCIMYFLLCGNPPFYASSPFGTFNKILNDNHSFEGRCWANISDSAKNLINKLLDKDSSKRISVKDALNHPWLSEIKSEIKDRPVNVPDYKENLEKFLGKNLLEQACAAYLVHHSSYLENEKELRNLFKKLDKSGDGRLTVQEMKEGFKLYVNDPFLDSHIGTIFSTMDNDGNNYIEYEEFIRASATISNNYSKAVLAEAFKHYDYDGSGRISSEELKLILKSNAKDENEIVQGIIKKIDLNGDGEVSFEEFLIMLNIK